MEFSETWEGRYPAIVRLWEHAWAEFIPFLNFDPEIRAVICTTNAIESLNARFPRARPAGISPTTKPRSSACTWSSVVSTRPGRTANAGPTAGRRPSTPSRAASRQAANNPTTHFSVAF